MKEAKTESMAKLEANPYASYDSNFHKTGEMKISQHNRENSQHSASASFIKRSKTPFVGAVRPKPSQRSTEVSERIKYNSFIDNEYANAPLAEPIKEKRYNSTARGIARSALNVNSQTDRDSSADPLEIKGGRIGLRTGAISVQEYVRASFKNAAGSKSELNYQPTDT